MDGSVVGVVPEFSVMLPAVASSTTLPPADVTRPVCSACVIVAVAVPACATWLTAMVACDTVTDSSLTR